MVQYLINCTAIWLLSLICYDLFLRRSTFHTYNRFYLLSTIIAGIVIPFFSFQQNKALYTESTNGIALQQTYAAKKTIETAAQINATNGIDWLYLLKIVYVLGVLISLAILLWNVFRIYALYRAADQTIVANTKVMETNGTHSPFSFMGYIFIGKIADFNDEELEMILTHEKQHNQLRHSIDLLIAQLCKVVFWFHPLPYIFYARLQMLHEYQADKVVAQPMGKYGNFLVAQTLFSAAPAGTHSFYYSPLKNRILMLTRKTSTMSKSKVLIAVPLFLVFILCFSKDAFSDTKRKKEGNKLTYNGNVFEMKGTPIDTVYVEDIETKERVMVVSRADTIPVKMNNEKIYEEKDVDIQISNSKLEDGLLNKFFKANQKSFSELEDGIYYIRTEDIVIGKDGKVKYYSPLDLTHNFYKEHPGKKFKDFKPSPVLPSTAKNKIENLLEDYLLNLQLTPAMLNGQKAICKTTFAVYNNVVDFVVKNHKAQLSSEVQGLEISGD